MQKIRQYFVQLPVIGRQYILPPPDGVDDGELDEREKDKAGAAQEPGVHQFEVGNLQSMCV